MSVFDSTSESNAAMDRELIALTQEGLPLVPKPYEQLAARLGVSEQDVIRRMEEMLDRGAIRRIAAVPNHYKLGFTANGMTVWDVPDSAARQVGEQIGGLDYVSHCYLRPRHLPEWPYNVFAMVHGKTREEVQQLAEQIHGMLGDLCRGRDILFSTRILKKTGLRIARQRQES